MIEIKKYNIQLPHGRINVVSNLVPNELAQKEEAPVVLVPGWGCTSKMYGPTLNELVLTGHDVMSIDFPRQGAGTFRSELDRQSATINDVLDVLQIRRVVGVPHSTGAIAVTKAAVENPGRYEAIAYFAPAGLDENTSMPKIAKRWLQQFKAGTSPRSSDQKLQDKIVATEALKHFLSNPKRALAEAADVSRTYMVSSIKQLAKLNVIMKFVVGKSDVMVRPAEVRAALSSVGIEDRLQIINGGHGFVGECPVEAVAIITALLTNRVTSSKSSGL